MSAKQSPGGKCLNRLSKRSLFFLIPFLFLVTGQTSSDIVNKQDNPLVSKQQVHLPMGGGITSIQTQNENIVIQRRGITHLEQPVEKLNHLTVTGTDDEDDTFLIEVSNNFCDTVLVEGGAGGFDVLELLGSESDKVVYNFYNNNDGNVEYDFDGDSYIDFVIEYTGLEPVTSTITASNVILNYGSSSETITITDGGLAQTGVDSDVGGESVTFANPSSSLTINGGDGNDDFVVHSFDDSFNADLIIDGEGGTNTFTCNAGVTVDAGTGNIMILCDNAAIGGNIQSTGMLFISPSTSGTTIGIGGGSGTLNLNDTELALLADGFADIIIGDASSGDIDINTAAFNDRVSLSTGGVIHDGSGTDITAPGIGVFGNTSPGQSPGVLTVSGDFTFAEGSSFTVEFGGTTPGSTSGNHDQLDVTGSVTIASNIPLSTSSHNGYTPLGNEVYTIISNDETSDAVSGTFKDLPEGAAVSSDFLSSGISAAISYTGGDGNDVVITVNDPLPVELISFNASLAESSIKLNWETATEVNNYGFEVERTSTSLGNQDENNGWEKVGFVQGHGNSNSPKMYEFIDVNPPADKLTYRLKQIDTDGTFKYYSEMSFVDASSVTSIHINNIPVEYSLGQNYPNPFNPTTTITFTIPKNDYTKLTIYDLLGKEIALLVDELKEAGWYEIQFDASKLSNGLYIYKIQSGSFVNSKKMLLLK